MFLKKSLTALFFGFFLTLVSASLCLTAKRVAVVPLTPQAPPVRHGIKVLKKKLIEAGFTTSQEPAPKHSPRILIADASTPSGKKIARKWKIHFQNPESFSVRLKKNTILVVGSDPVGTMYGLYDVAEQVSWGQMGQSLTKRVRVKTEAPFVRIRGVNPFLHTQALWDQSSWFFSTDFWTKYLDQLSFNRYNFLDIHGVYDIYNTDFYNFFTYFVKSKQFPQIGSSKTDCERNLAMFKKIVQMAKERGIRVGLMNYNMGSYVGQPRPGRFRGDPHITAKRLNGKELEAYLHEVTVKFLKAVPDLWIFGFRIGESRKPADFFRRTYVRGMKDSGNGNLNLYTRSWLTTRKAVESFAHYYPNHFYVEIKYNGEHMGPPYHAITGPRPWHLSYSYEAYTDVPQNFKIIWQVRFNGTHRIFRWGDPEFVRRTVETLHFGRGVGFTIEPMQAYFPWTDFYHNTARVDHHFFDWGFQRDWFWNLLWGRLSYNPNLDTRVWMSEFERRFGRAGAADVEDLVATSSKVIPLAYQAHCLGVDHRSDAPEYEVGNNAFRWGENREDLGIDGFLPVKALDSTAYSGVREYVSEQLSGRVSGRHSPLAVARRLKAIASRIFATIQRTNMEVDPSNKEYDCTKMDAEALANFALYYSEKLQAAVDLEFFKQTKDWGTLKPAILHAQRAYDDWADLAQVTAIHYRPLVEELRMRTNDYTWQDQLPILKSDIQTLKGEIYWLAQSTATYAGPPKIGHTPIFRAEPGKSFPVTASLLFWKGGLRHAPRGHMWVFYRHAGEKSFQSLELRRHHPNITFGGTIPAKETAGASGFEYYLKATARGKTVFWPKGAPEKFFSVDMSRDTTPPTITYTFQSVQTPVDHLTLRARIHDASGIQVARVYYKEIPSYLPWKAVAMKKVGRDVYQATIPLNFHGVLYHFEAIDVHNNGTKFPDTWKARPYFVVPAWEPKTN